MTNDGLPAWELRFPFSSNRLGLALCATVGERWRRSFERLRSGEDLGRWLVEAGLLPAPPPVNKRQLTEARNLREAIYRTVCSAMTEEDVRFEDAATINRLARHPAICPQLGSTGARETWAGSDPVVAGLSTVAADAVELLTSPQLNRVRECEAADCALLFLDTSRPGRRRWCADRACGSRSRSAAYRQRRYAAT